MKTIKQRAVQRHIEAYYPNARITSYKDTESGLKFYTKEELAELDEDWFPLACEQDPESGLIRYGGRAGVVHTYVEGFTGAGKTTRYVMQCIRALSCTKSKPSFLIVDIHGEILPNVYGHLSDMGYEIKVLNCRNAERSDTYNPLLQMGIEAKNGCELRYDNVSRIVSVLQPDTISHDPIWDQGARAYFAGVVADKLEDVQSRDLPLSCLTLYNVVENHFWLRNEVEGHCHSLDVIPHYRNKGSSCYSVQKMMAVLHSPDRTRASYMGVGESKLELVAQPLLYKLSSGNSINVEECVDRPTAIIVQSANHMVGDALVSLLVNDIYDEMDKRFKEKGFDPKSRRMHCFLDEFANCRIASEDAFIRMLTTSRKMGMYWHLLVQSDAQLKGRFSEQGGATIRSNTTEIFMGSMDYETQLRFSKACGQTTVQALSSHVGGYLPSLCIVDTLTVDRLNCVSPGTVFIRSEGRPIMQSYYEAFYRCPDFSRACDPDEIYPHNSFLQYKETRFTPDDIPPYVTHDHYKILHALDNGPLRVGELIERTGLEAEVNKLLRSRHLIHKEDGMVSFTLTPLQMQVLYEREETGDAAQEAPGEACVAKADPDDVLDPSDKEPDLDRSEEVMCSTMVHHMHVEQIREHLKNVREQISVDALDELSCVPTDLREVYKLLWEDPDAEYYGGRGPVDTANRVLKFEVIEAFISHNEFDSKESWDLAFENEIKALIHARLFPAAVLSAFRKAYHELRDELSLENICEIRRIINGE